MDRSYYKLFDSRLKIKKQDFKNKLFITSDLEWAPDRIIKETTEFFSKKNIPLTIFATHESKYILNLYKERFHEVGIHPSITNKFKSYSIQSNILKLKKVFPEAIGVRCHSLWQSSSLSFIFKEAGLLYESNILLPVNWKCFPFVDWSGIIKIPFIWEDDTALYIKNIKSIWEIFNNAGAKVINIHPLQFYLNAPTLDFYNVNKNKIYRSRKDFSKYINTKVYGVRDLINDFITNSKGYEFICLREMLNSKS